MSLPKLLPSSIASTMLVTAIFGHTQAHSAEPDPAPAEASAELDTIVVKVDTKPGWQM